jgi:hypothetical protein
MKRRTTLELDPKLIGKAMELSGIKTKTEVIERALEDFIRGYRIERLIALGGTLDSMITPEEFEKMRRKGRDKAGALYQLRYGDEIAEGN